MKHLPLKTGVAIIGGGITGLSAAYHLQAYARAKGMKIDFLLLEKASRLGGTILTEYVDGFTVEGGPDCFLSEKMAAIKLCHKLGIQDELLHTNEALRRTFILWRGRLHELPEGFMLLAPTNITSFLKNPLISPWGKLRMALDLVLPTRTSAEEESLGQFVRRRLGREVLERIAEPLIAGIHAGDADTMSVKSTFPRFIELEAQHRSLILGMMKRRKQYLARKKGKDSASHYTMFMSLKRGLGALIDAVAATLPPEAIRTGCEVGAVEPSAVFGERGGRERYCLRLSDGRALQAHSVIVAVPSYLAARLCASLDPRLSQVLLSIPYVSTATVSLAYARQEIGHPLNGFGFVVPKAEKRNIMASTWSSAKFSHRAPLEKVLLRCFVGGVQNEQLCGLEDEEMVFMVRKELREIMGVTATPLYSWVFRWEKSLPQYTLGHEKKVDTIMERLSSHPGLVVAGGAYRGVGLSDCIRSGEDAALHALES